MRLTGIEDNSIEDNSLKADYHLHYQIEGTEYHLDHYLDSLKYLLDTNQDMDPFLIGKLTRRFRKDLEK